MNFSSEEVLMIIERLEAMPEAFSELPPFMDIPPSTSISTLPAIVILEPPLSSRPLK